MKRRSFKAAFTLIEVLVVAVIIAVLLFVLLPVRTGRPGRSPAVACMSNLKQLGLGLMMWNQDNDGCYPWQVSVTNEGTRELVFNGHVSSQFQGISGYIRATAAYLCPSEKTRYATNYENLTDSNVSYFLNLDVGQTNPAAAILAGDRHLEANDQPVNPGLRALTASAALDWTSELHSSSRRPAGGLTFVDGHSEITISTNLNAIFQRQASRVSRLLIP